MPRRKSRSRKSRSPDYKNDKVLPGIHMGFPKKMPYDNAYVLFYSDNNPASPEVLVGQYNGKNIILGGRRYINRQHEADSEHNPVHTAIRVCFEQLFGKASAGIKYDYNVNLFNKHYDAIVEELFLHPQLVKDCVSALKEYDQKGGFAGHMVSVLPSGEINVTFYWPITILNYVLLPFLRYQQEQLMIENFNFGKADPIYESFFTAYYPDGKVPVNVNELRSRRKMEAPVKLDHASLSSVRSNLDTCHLADKSAEGLIQGLRLRKQESQGVAFYTPKVSKPLQSPYPLYPSTPYQYPSAYSYRPNYPSYTPGFY